MSHPFKTINGKPIFYQQGNIVHSVEGGKGPNDINILWTLCNIDVPANEGFISSDAVVTCPGCKEKEL